MIAAIYVAAMLIFTGVHSHQHHHYSRPGAATVFALESAAFPRRRLGTLAVIGIGSAYKTMALARRRQRGVGNDGRTARQPQHD